MNQRHVSSTSHAVHVDDFLLIYSDDECLSKPVMDRGAATYVGDSAFEVLLKTTIGDFELCNPVTSTYTIARGLGQAIV